MIEIIIIGFNKDHFLWKLNDLCWNELFHNFYICWWIISWRVIWLNPRLIFEIRQPRRHLIVKVEFYIGKVPVLFAWIYHWNYGSWIEICAILGHEIVLLIHRSTFYIRHQKNNEDCQNRDVSVVETTSAIY